MGFWDVGLGDLEALGIPVTEAQEHVLEHGGEVLFIRGLLSPWHWYGDDTGILDQDGSQIYIPQLLIAYSPYETRVPGWRPESLPVRRQMEDEFGTAWREWPSYVGEVIERSVEQRPYSDGFDFVRVWDGVPLVTPEDYALAEELYMAAIHRVQSSVYEEFMVVTDYESGGDASVDELIDLMDAGADLADFAEQLGSDPDYLHMVATAIETLLLGGYILRAGEKRIEKEVSFSPMEAYLSPAATKAWTRLVNRRENTIEIINCALGPKAGRSFASEERMYT